MIQVDVFWSFAIGACFAALSAKQLKVEGSVTVNSYFVYTICFLSILFAPSGVYLLWEFPGWESMFVLNRDMITGSLIAAFASTNVLFGAVGFIVAAFFIRRGSPLVAHSLWISAYVIMFGILGFGYKRFTYAGNAADWAAGVEYPIKHFFTSRVFYTLLSMGTVFLPTLFYPIIFWPKNCGSKKPETRAAFRRLLLTAFLEVLFAALIYAMCIYYFATPEQIEYLTMTDFDFVYKTHVVIFGAYSPLVGFLIAETVFLSVTLFPFLLQRDAGRGKRIKRKKK